MDEWRGHRPERMKRIASWYAVVAVSMILLPLLLVAATARADIELAKETFERDTDPITAALSVTGLPDGAKIRGTFTVSGRATVTERSGYYIPQVGPDGKPVLDESGKQVLVPAPTEYFIDAAPGEHVITAQGVWVLTRDVTVGGESFPVLVDFGQYTFTKSFVVSGGDDPVPPPPPPGTRWGLILHESTKDTPAQGALWVELRKTWQENRLRIYDKDELPPSQRAIMQSEPYRQYVAKKGLLPALIVLTESAAVLKVVPCPDSASGIENEVNQ